MSGRRPVPEDHAARLVHWSTRHVRAGPDHRQCLVVRRPDELKGRIFLGRARGLAALRLGEAHLARTDRCQVADRERAAYCHADVVEPTSADEVGEPSTQILIGCLPLIDVIAAETARWAEVSAAVAGAEDRAAARGAVVELLGSTRRDLVRCPT